MSIFVEGLWKAIIFVLYVGLILFSGVQSGQVFTWGNNPSTALGCSISDGQFHINHIAAFDSNPATAVHCTLDATVVVDRRGRVWCAGRFGIFRNKL